eukprot:SAG31_NODE_5115_length_2731_cov_15.741261_1_plen_768_part_10
MERVIAERAEMEQQLRTELAASKADLQEMKAALVGQQKVVETQETAAAQVGSMAAEVELERLQGEIAKAQEQRTTVERQIEAADAARQEAERTRAEEAAAAAAAQATTQRLKQDLASAMHALEMEKRQRAAELAQATADRTAVQEQLAAMRANEQNMETEKTAVERQLHAAAESMKAELAEQKRVADLERSGNIKDVEMAVERVIAERAEMEHSAVKQSVESSVNNVVPTSSDNAGRVDAGHAVWRKLVADQEADAELRAAKLVAEAAASVRHGRPRTASGGNAPSPAQAVLVPAAPARQLLSNRDQCVRSVRTAEGRDFCACVAWKKQTVACSPTADGPDGFGMAQNKKSEDARVNEHQQHQKPSLLQNGGQKLVEKTADAELRAATLAAKGPVPTSHGMPRAAPDRNIAMDDPDRIGLPQSHKSADEKMQELQAQRMDGLLTDEGFAEALQALVTERATEPAKRPVATTKSEQMAPLEAQLGSGSEGLPLPMKEHGADRQLMHIAEGKVAMLEAELKVARLQDLQAEQHQAIAAATEVMNAAAAARRGAMQQDPDLRDVEQSVRAGALFDGGGSMRSEHAETTVSSKHSEEAAFDHVLAPSVQSERLTAGRQASSSALLQTSPAMMINDTSAGGTAAAVDKSSNLRDFNRDAAEAELAILQKKIVMVHERLASKVPAKSAAHGMVASVAETEQTDDPDRIGLPQSHKSADEKMQELQAQRMDGLLTDEGFAEALQALVTERATEPAKRPVATTKSEQMAPLEAQLG